LADTYECFGENCCLHLQGRNVSSTLKMIGNYLLHYLGSHPGTQ